MKLLKSFICSLALLLTMVSAAQSTSDTTDTANKEKKVVVFDIKEEIAPPIWHKTKKAIQQAKDINADLIVIHMNTYGGMLESADSIRTILLDTKIPVSVFIDNNAASAGALISIACDSIYMRAGANIGAATVVNQEGKAMPDKYQSYMRSMMRATAEAKNRDPQIAQAMVDPRIVVEGVIDSSMVLTFTTSEAIEHGFCEGQTNNLDEVIRKSGFSNYKIIKQQLTTSDHIIGFLINPFISGILIMLIIGGIYFELQSPGLGFPSAAAVIAALLYFAPLYIEGLAANWEILLFIIGLILVAVEIFAIPGFGIAGILGIGFITVGLTLAMVESFEAIDGSIDFSGVLKALFIVITAMFLSLLGSIYLSRKLFSGSTIFGTLALTASQQKSEGFSSSYQKYEDIIGQEAKAYTNLRPAGKIMFEGELYDAVAESGFIEKENIVSIKSYQNGQLVVRQKL